MYVSSISDILEVYCRFHIDVTQVDPDVAHVTMAIHVFFKSLFKMFYLFQTYIASVFIWMLHMLQMTMLQVYVSNVWSV
jgi:hypothetical protein